jgi:alkaline phosphatase
MILTTYVGGTIDLALHKNYAKFAITEVLAMEKAVEIARKMTSKEDTLIIVTADHSHVLTLPGYMKRNMSIFGPYDCLECIVI